MKDRILANTEPKGYCVCCFVQLRIAKVKTSLLGPIDST